MRQLKIVSLLLAISPPGAGMEQTLKGVVHGPGAPQGVVYVVAYPAVDRYNWPWWDVYGFLRYLHEPGALDAMRPAPLAVARLERPGPFEVALPAGASASLFALLDADASGLERGASPPDWIGRFPRNPLTTRSLPRSLEIELQPLIWSPDYERLRYAVPDGGGDGLRFRELSEASGIRFRHCQGGDLGQLPVVVGSGALLEDLDEDGDLDLYAVQGMGECPGASLRSVLYANDGRGRFRDVTPASGAGLSGTGMGVVGGDYDADGDIDLYITSYQGGRLLRNDGALRFHDVTETAGVGAAGSWLVGASFGDVDGDGRLDLYVAGYVDFSLAPPFTPDREIPTFSPAMLSSPFAFPAIENLLFQNQGEGRFARIGGALGASDPAGKGMAVTLVDLDLDLDLDLYVTNDCTKDRIFENRGGRFVDVSELAQVADLSSGMGIAVGDLDGDSLPELFSPHWLNEPVVLYANQSTPSRLAFEEQTYASGLAGVGVGLTGWAGDFFDADLDGDLDLLVTNGHTHPGRDPRTLEPQPLQLFLNDGRGRFRDASAALRAALPEPAVWRGAALGDVDGDGRTDVYLAAWNGPGRLLRNQSPGGHWLHVRLRTAGCERGAIGARVSIEAGGRKQTRQVVSGAGYLSHSSLDVEFGLGAERRIDALEVVWPSGRVKSYTVQGVDRVVTIEE